MVKFSIENVNSVEVRRALEENQALLTPEKHKVAHNINVVLAYIVRQLGQINGDVSLLHNKLQPILVELAEESNWRIGGTEYRSMKINHLLKEAGRRFGGRPESRKGP
jgi:hypothetical protein